METLTGWNIVRADVAEWTPWGSHGNARAKVLGTADGYYVTLVESDAGYRGDPHGRQRITGVSSRLAPSDHPGLERAPSIRS